jgi:hypothetical protein
VGVRHGRQFVLCISVYFKFGSLEMKIKIYLLVLLHVKFVYLIIGVSVVGFVNTKLGHCFVKNGSISAVF